MTSPTHRPQRRDVRLHTTAPTLGDGVATDRFGDLVGRDAPARSGDERGRDRALLLTADLERLPSVETGDIAQRGELETGRW